MAVRIADVIAAELTPEMRAAFDAADLLIEVEARYLAQHLTAGQLEGLYVRELTGGGLHDVAVALRACQIADAPRLGPDLPGGTPRHARALELLRAALA